MESKKEEQALTFKRLQSALIMAVNNRILNGEYTERGLARILGVSQPQIHNVLKGARKLTPELADRILLKLNVNLLELIGGDHHDVRLRLPSWTYPTAEKLLKSNSRGPVGQQNIQSRLSAEDAS